MDSERDFGEHPVKRECLDEGDLEMVNYEMPMQIEVPDDGEVDPLMPVEADQAPPDTPQPSCSLYFVRPMKSEPETHLGTPDIGESESSLTSVNSVIPESGFSASAERCDGSNGEVSDFQEITIEPKHDIDRLVAGSEEIRVVERGGDEHSEIQHYQQLLFNTCQQTPNTDLRRFNGFDQFYSPADRLDRVQQFATSLNEPLRASQNVQWHSNALRHQEDVSTVSHLSLPTYDNQRVINASSNEFHSAGGAHIHSQQIHPETSQTYPPCYESQDTSLPAAAAAVANVPPLHQSREMQQLPIAEPVSVIELLRNQFLGGYWTEKQKKAIITLSRPKPTIDTLRNVSTKLFYDKIPWLCGCARFRKFFCWPCLLFSYNSTNAEVWSIPATLALNDKEFIDSCEDHRSSQCHRDAAAKLYLRYPTGTSQAAREKPNPSSMKDLLFSEKVRRNRKLLSLLVQSVCYLRKEKPDARTLDYAECFSHVVMSNRKLQETLREFQGSSDGEAATKFVFNYAHLVDKSIEKFVKSTISEELKDTRFVTLFMEDLSKIVDKSTVATIAHFVDKAGDVQQRIIEVNEIGSDRSAGTVFALFERSVFQRGLRMKVAGFTYSATLVHPSEITAFNERVQRLCPNAKPFHYQGHNLFGMLFGAISHLNCSNFFNAIAQLQVFFKKHLTTTFHHFELYSNAQFPRATYDFDYGFVTTIKRSYSSVLETFSSILRCPGEWDNAISSQAPIFMNFLQHTTTRFFIALISRLNSAVSDVTEVLQGKIEPAVWKIKIREAISNLIGIKNFGFEDIYTTAMSPTLAKGSRTAINSYPQELVCIFIDVMDTAIVFLHQRFVSVDFGYVDFDSVASSFYARLRLTPFEIETFRSQIDFLAKESIIKGKSLPEAVKTISKHDWSKVVPYYSTFLIFALTIPSSNTSLDCPAVERILKHQPHDSCKFSCENLIWMEKELLADISRQKNLTEAVIDILATSQNMKEFSFERFEEPIVID